MMSDYALLLAQNALTIDQKKKNTTKARRPPYDYNEQFSKLRCHPGDEGGMRVRHVFQASRSGKPRYPSANSSARISTNCSHYQCTYPGDTISQVTEPEPVRAVYLLS